MRVLAACVPLRFSLHVSVGAEHIYRNPRTEVQRLLEKYHSGRYKVYNFANEPGRTYPDQLFQGRVERFVCRILLCVGRPVPHGTTWRVGVWYDATWRVRYWDTCSSRAVRAHFSQSAVWRET